MSRDFECKKYDENRWLAKSIADFSWSEFIRQLEYKSVWKGKTVLKIDQWFPLS
jgi:putative transposase